MVYDSGLQVSGTLASFNNGFFKMNGPVALAFNGYQLEGQGKQQHNESYSSPFGKLISEQIPLAYRAIPVDKLLVLHFESGI